MGREASRRASLNPTAWLVWTACAASAALLMRNPWYLICLAGVVLWIGWRLTGERPGRGTWILAGSLLLTSTLINVIFSRAGQTVLLDLSIPYLGGPYTLEALLFGLSAGFQVVTLLLVMGVFARALTSVDLLRRTPRGLYPLGVAATIGMSFAPHARQSFTDLREARELRGAPGGWREVPRLLAPMVFEALERAMEQAESLAVRGWGSAAPAGNHRWQVGLAWAAIGASVLLCAARPDRVEVAVVLLATAIVVRWAAFRGAPSPVRSRPEPWRLIDTLVVGLSLGAAVSLLLFAGRGLGSLAYYPYPLAYPPTVAAAPLIAIACLAGPGAANSR